MATTYSQAVTADNAATEAAAILPLKKLTSSVDDSTSHESVVSFQVTDEAGDPVAEVTPIVVWLSDLATGLGGSAHTHSTGPAFTAGEIVAALIANDAWIALTDATGLASLHLVDTADEDVFVNGDLLSGFGAPVQEETSLATV